MRRLAWLAVLLAASMLVVSCADERNTFLSTAGTSSTTAAASPAHHQGETCATCHTDWNLEALHDSSSTVYGNDCIKCHGDMSSETTLSAQVQGIHTRMCPFVYQATGQTSMTNTVCVYCHTTVDLRDESAGNIRRQVAMSKCNTCHTAAGPGRQLYMQ